MGNLLTYSLSRIGHIHFVLLQLSISAILVLMKPARSTKPKTLELNAQQVLFVKEYLKDLNASAAYCRAGYKVKGANSSGTRLLSDVRIANAVAKEFELRSAKVDIKVEDIIKELHAIATSNVADAVLDDGRLKSIHDMPLALQKAVSEIVVEENWEFVETTNGRKVKEQNGWTKRIKFWEKTKSLELLGKYLAMWIEKHEVTGPGGQPLPAVTVTIHKYTAPGVDRIQTLAVEHASSPSAQT